MNKKWMRWNINRNENEQKLQTHTEYEQEWPSSIKWMKSRYEQNEQLL